MHVIDVTMRCAATRVLSIGVHCMRISVSGIEHNVGNLNSMCASIFVIYSSVSTRSLPVSVLVACLV